MPPLVIAPLNKRRYFHLGLAALLIAVGLLKFTLGGGGDALDAVVMFGMISGGLAWGLWTFMILRRRGDAVVLDADGVTILVPLIGRIGWSEISMVRTDTVRSRGYLHIVLRDPAASVAANPVLARHLADAEVWFDASEIDISVNQLAEAIIVRRNAAIS